MGVKVYFEGGNCSWADHIATFADEECYDICIEALEKYAEDNGCIVTESVEEGSSELDRAVAATPPPAPERGRAGARALLAAEARQ